MGCEEEFSLQVVGAEVGGRQPALLKSLLNVRFVPFS